MLKFYDETLNPHIIAGSDLCEADTCNSRADNTTGRGKIAAEIQDDNVSCESAVGFYDKDARKCSCFSCA